MGYTHYFNFKTESVNKEQFAEAVELFKKCLSEVKNVKLGNGIGEDEPIITSERICFNGWAENDEDYETFNIDANHPCSDFCKTARNPYDIAVCLCLLSFKEVFGDDFEYDSDGTRREDIANPSKYMQEYSARTGYIYTIEDEWQRAYDIFDKIAK